MAKILHKRLKIITFAAEMSEERCFQAFLFRFFTGLRLNVLQPVQRFQKSPQMISKQEIIDLADQYLLESDSESFLVDVTVSRDNQIVVEIDNDEAVDIDECVQLSQYIEQHLDRNKEDFELEVGSAGLTSPLKVLRQYAKFEGEEVEVLMRDGRKLTGTLGAADEEGFDLAWTTMEKVTDPATGKPGKKKQTVEHNEKLCHADVNQVKYVINF